MYRLLFIPFMLLLGCSSEADGPGGGHPGSASSSASPSEAGPEPSRGTWEDQPESRWSLEEELRIGALEGDPPYVFGRIRNLIPDPEGGVWVFDLLAVELRHFGADGRHLLSVGRRGEGPGEFSGNTCATQGAGDEIWVETETNWHRFSKDGQLLGTFPTPSTLACGLRLWLPNGQYLVQGMDFDWETGERREYFVLLDWADGAFLPVDTLSPPPVPEPETVTFVNASGRSRSTSFIPFIHNAGWALERGARFWVWDGGGDYDIRLQTMDGDTLRRVSRSYSPVRIQADARQEAIDELLRPGWRAETSFHESRVPDVYPPFSSVRLAEDQSVWVRREAGEGRVARDIFSQDGHYLGELQVPEELTGLGIRHMGEDHVWGILRDDLGVQFVVRARIVKGS